MKKPRLLYASPFWPLKSGISNYSEMLVVGLSKYFDITLLTDDYKIQSQALQEFPVVVYKSGSMFTGFDKIIYNFGNQPEYHSYMYDAILSNPGHIILHDYSLYYLTVGYYGNEDKILGKIYEMHGSKGIQAVKCSVADNPAHDLLHHKNLSPDLPLNKEIINAASGVLVHSFYARDLLLAQYPSAKVEKIELLNITNDNAAPDTGYINKKYGIPENAFLVLSAGFIAPTKQNHLICKAVKAFNEKRKDKIYYLMVGEGDYVDSYLDNFIKKTGYVSDSVYWTALRRSNMIFNLRYPTNGENSATLVQAMGLGKPCCVTDIGSFGEYPDDTVVKFPYDVSIETLLDELSKFVSGGYDSFGINAKKYVDECSSIDMVSAVVFNVLYK